MSEMERVALLFLRLSLCLRRYQVSQLHVSEMERVVLLRLMGATLTGVPLSRFEIFFSVSLTGGHTDKALSDAQKAEKDRKMARWRRVRDVRHIKEGGAMGVDERNVMIVAARLMRESHKTQKITEFLGSCLTERVVVHPSFGSVCFFTHILRNPFHEDRCVRVVFGAGDVVVHPSFESVCFFTHIPRKTLSREYVCTCHV